MGKYIVFWKDVFGKSLFCECSNRFMADNLAKCLKESGLEVTRVAEVKHFERMYG